MAEVPVPNTAGDVEAQRMELDLDAFDDKVEILPGYEQDLSAATFCLHNEDHTLGNALRWMLMKSPDVEFCGYSNPHPSEPKIHLRIQMYDQKSSLEALRAALDNLEDLFTTIGDAYQTNLDKGEYERVKEPGMNEEELQAIVQRGDEIRAQLRQEGKGLADR